MYGSEDNTYDSFEQCYYYAWKFWNLLHTGFRDDPSKITFWIIPEIRNENTFFNEINEYINIPGRKDTKYRYEDYGKIL